MNKIKKHKKIIILSLIFIVILVILMVIKIIISNRNDKHIVTISKQDMTNNTEILSDGDGTSSLLDTDLCYVDIKGAVQTPGVYVLKSGSRVKDVIELAGGLIESSDTSLINLSKTIWDEMVIVIYTKDEVQTNSASINTTINDAYMVFDGSASSSDVQVNRDIININTATLEELKSLSGVGESKAKSIIAYRQEYGNFANIEDIMNVKGIGQTIYEKIKNNITV